VVLCVACWRQKIVPRRFSLVILGHHLVQVPLN
jgi:hypothetical protein